MGSPFSTATTETETLEHLLLRSPLKPAARRSLAHFYEVKISGHFEYPRSLKRIHCYRSSVFIWFCTITDMGA